MIKLVQTAAAGHSAAYPRQVVLGVVVGVVVGQDVQNLGVHVNE